MYSPKLKFTPGKDKIFYTLPVFGQEEIDAVTKCLREGWLGPGKYTEKFEKKIAGLYGKKFGLFVNSGSSANLVAVEIAGLPKGSEVITQACTFPTTLSPLLVMGLKPVFVDSEIGTYNIDAAKIEAAISKKTKAIIISHAIGNINDMRKISKICKKYNLIFIEDSCDTIGGKFAKKPTGSWSDITTTSFYAPHHITAAGGGGMVMTNNSQMIKEAKIFRDWGRVLPEDLDEDYRRRFSFKLDNIDYDGKFTYVKLGFNFKPIEAQAAFGLTQVKRLTKFNKVRARNFKRLFNFLKRFEDHFMLPQSHPDATVYWLAFPLTIRDESPILRKHLLTFLERHYIQTRLLFSGNILHHDPYKKIDYRISGDLKNAETIFRKSFIIGCGHGLTDQMIDYICEIFEQYMRGISKSRSKKADVTL